MTGNLYKLYFDTLYRYDKKEELDDIA